MNLFQLSCPVSIVSQLLYLHSREVVFRETNCFFFSPGKPKAPGPSAAKPSKRATRGCISTMGFSDKTNHSQVLVSHCPLPPLRPDTGKELWGCREQTCGSPVHLTFTSGDNHSISASKVIDLFYRSHTLYFQSPSWLVMLLWHTGNDAKEASTDWPLDAQHWHQLVPLGFIGKSNVSNQFSFPSFPPCPVFTEESQMEFIFHWSKPK